MCEGFANKRQYGEQWKVYKRQTKCIFLPGI